MLPAFTDLIRVVYVGETAQINAQTMTSAPFVHFLPCTEAMSSQVDTKTFSTHYLDRDPSDDTSGSSAAAAFTTTS